MKAYKPELTIIMRDVNKKKNNVIDNDVYFSKSDVVIALGEFIKFGKNDINDLTRMEMSVTQVREFLNKFNIDVSQILENEKCINCKHSYPYCESNCKC